MPDTPPLEKIIRDAVQEGTAQMHTQVPGRILSYDHDEQKAKVQLIVKHAYDNEGEVDYYKPAPLVNVPVIFPAIMTWPLEEGDPGWVQFAERSIDEYQATGNDTTEPADVRRFDLSDATFYPTYMRGEADTADAAVLSFDEIHLGSSNPGDFLALASLVKAELDAIWSAINEHTHEAGTLLDSDGGTVTGATAPAISGSANDVNSDKIKAE